jgi:hypothetical protein
LNVNLNGVMGIQDLYFVFKNPEIEGKPLFGLTTLEFVK